MECKRPTSDSAAELPFNGRGISLALDFRAFPAAILASPVLCDSFATAMTETTGSPEQDPLLPMLESAQSELEGRLEEACAHDVSRESTGELMRLEEALLDAARAAKQTVSLRRRIRTSSDEHEVPGAAKPRSGEAPKSASRKQSADVSDHDAHESMESHERVGMREFRDERGVEWRAWAVTPLPGREARLTAQLGEFRDGWLAFETSDGNQRRRLREYPKDWAELSLDQLPALLATAQEVRSRRKAPESSRDAPRV